MKRLFVVVLAFLLTVLSIGCTSKTKASAKAISVGQQALGIVDDYLDGKISYEKASNYIDGFESDLDYVSDFDLEGEYTDEEYSEHVADFAISSDISMISYNLLSDYYGDDSTAYDELIKSRNDLAEDIGEKKR